LTSVVFKDAGEVVTKSIAYIYDGNDRRIGQKLNGVVTERYVYDRDQIALVFDGAGTQTHRYLYGTAVDQVLADETATGMVWALADNQGTVKDLVDNSGVVVNHITYDSFGKVVAQSSSGVDFRYGYTGREQDGETGLDYYRARYYDASNGRFISEDPLGFDAGDTNIYRYVGNSPTYHTDPSGLQSETSNPFLEVGILFGTAFVTGAKYLGDRLGDFADGGKVNNATILPRRQGTPGEFDPNYGRNNDPTITFSPIHIRAKGSGFNLPTHTTFPGTGACSIGGKFNNTAHGPKENHFIPFFSVDEEDPNNFTPPPITRDRHDRLTNGTYTLDRAGMIPHTTGSTSQGKSQFLSDIDADRAVLDAAAYADQHGLWKGSKATVPVSNGSVGVHGRTGNLTNTINVYRTENGFVHGSPSSPQ
jgi:RHS repeat-associated protein